MAQALQASASLLRQVLPTHPRCRAIAFEREIWEGVRVIDNRGVLGVVD